MHGLMQRHEMAVVHQPARAHASYGNGLVGNAAWSIRSCFIAPTTDHKAKSPGRSPVIPW